MMVSGRAVVWLLTLSHVGTGHGQGASTQYTALRNGTSNAETRVTIPNTDVCGKHGGRLKRVVGGSDAGPGMFPWIAALGYRSTRDSSISWLCAGSLVTDTYVVTAAQCVIINSLGVLSLARLGITVLNRSEAGPTETDYEVDTWIHHPGFNGQVLNDIAIVRLKNKVTFSHLIKPICLPILDEFRTKNFTGYAAYIAGWGRTGFAGPTATRLQQAQILIWDQEKCTTLYSGMKTVEIDNTVICAGDEVKDSCQGDSGGPLMMPYGPDSNYYLYGIVSYGYPCGAGHPGVHTRVSEFMNWILKNMK